MPEPKGSARLVSEEDIRLILSDERRLSLVSQPVVDLRRGVVAGYEILSRFKLDVPAAPDPVFACANRVGLGAQLEALVVRRALGLLKYIPANCFLAINVDPEHLTSDHVLDAIVAQGNLGNVVFELTEHRPIENLESVARWLGELRKLGAFTAMDDAGSGYLGLQQIHVIRPQFLKIDRALVADVHLDEVKRAMIQMLGDLAARLDAWIVAEGIESEAELHALAQLGVPLAQGYFLARPALGWTGISAEAERALGALPSDVRSSNVIASLVEPCSTCDLQTDWPEGQGVSLRLEASGRPILMRVVDELGERFRAEHELLRVKRGSPLAAVALRSCARQEAHRWDPIVCIDDLGHFEGIVHVHRLVSALADGSKRRAPEVARPLGVSCGALQKN